MKEWKVKGSESIFSCRLFSLRKDRALSPRTGRELDFYVIDTMDWVGVIPLMGDRVVMVRQFRHGVKEICLEIPGGLVEEGDPLAAARRELKEETGYGAQEMELLGALFPQPALFNNRFFVYLARGLERIGELELDEGEDIEVLFIPLGEVREMIRRGEVTHALVLAAFQLLFSRYPSLEEAS